jgi:protein tyrosine/serine phosphatase
MNIRAVGGLRTSNTQVTSVKPLHIFRSADLSRITTLGKEQLSSLGIKFIFDLRSQQEIARDDPAPLAITGITVANAPVVDKETMKNKHEKIL